ncbi:Gmad2 immunoglobulin-like domain-containing protein [Ktedonosporobacter rubrisoli]|nr:Gmad2 immunoglobulin-like domain-containing protein [Ktedonosporobacter rubrisoli]
MQINLKRLYSVLISLLSLGTLVFMLTACRSGPQPQSTTSATPTAATGARATATSTSTLSGSLVPMERGVPAGPRGAQPCPASVSSPAHWNPIIPTQPDVSSVDKVTCGNLLGNDTLQALVTVIVGADASGMDLYVFDKITSPNPQKLFMLQGLVKGDAKISAYNTIITAEVDLNSAQNKNRPKVELGQDLYREFQWKNDAETFVPISFPGIFPVLTRWQAEFSQQQVSQGHQPWMNDAAMTGSAFAANLLKWAPDSPASVVSGGGQNDTQAVVDVKSKSPGANTIHLTMNRLENNAQNIWIVVAAASPNMSIDLPKPLDRLSSPVNVSGNASAFEGVVGKVVVLDHSYTQVGQAEASGASGMGKTTFSASIPYSKTFKGGDEPGLVALYTNSQADGSISGAVFVRELLS